MILLFNNYNSTCIGVTQWQIIMPNVLFSRSRGSTLPPPPSHPPFFPNTSKPAPLIATVHHTTVFTPRFFICQSVHKQFAKLFIYVNSHVQRALVARACTHGTPHTQGERDFLEELPGSCISAKWSRHAFPRLNSFLGSLSKVAPVLPFQGAKHTYTVVVRFRCFERISTWKQTKTFGLNLVCTWGFLGVVASEFWSQ